MLFEVLIPITTFDMINEDYFHMVMNFNPDGESLIPERFQDLGYGNNAVLNLGSVFVANCS